LREFEDRVLRRMIGCREEGRNGGREGEKKRGLSEVATGIVINYSLSQT
jgi:hypothetical protein